MGSSLGDGTNLDPVVRAQLVAEFRQRWTRAGRPGLVQHILGNMSAKHGVPLGVLKSIARTVRAEDGQDLPQSASGGPPTVTAATPLAVVDGSNLAWARTSDDGHPRLDNLTLVRSALAERGYQALVVVDAALRHQLDRQDAGELDRQIAAQELIQAPAETDADLWVIAIADHHGAPIISNDRFDEYRATYPWLRERRVAVVLVDHTALLQGDALDGSGRPPATPAALREEIEELRQSASAAHARAEDVAALRGRLARLEGSLAREQARSAEARAEIERLGLLLTDERRMGDTLRQEIRQHPEQVSRLSKELTEAQEEAATARGQRVALQDRVRDLERQLQQLSARRPEERGAAATRSDLDAVNGQLRGEIRDLARAVKDAQSPLPRILAMTREVREAVTHLHKSQGHTGEALERLEQAARAQAFKTDYLVAMAEEDAEEDDVDDDDDEFDEELDQAIAHDRTGPAEASADLAEIVIGDQDAQPAATGASADLDDWRSEFHRIEEAWLAGRMVGDAHEALNFLHLLVDLRLENLESSAILSAFDRFRTRAGGERFSYCPLHGAIHLVRARKPSLDNGLVLVRYRELVKLPPCAGVEDCPGLGEVLSRMRR